MTTTTETRSTLRDRLLARHREDEATVRRLDGNGEPWAIMLARDTRAELVMLSAVEGEPAALLDFDAWLDGEWLAHKHHLSGTGLAFAVKAWAERQNPAEAFRMYEDLFVYHEERYDDGPDDDFD